MWCFSFHFLYIDNNSTCRHGLNVVGTGNACYFKCQLLFSPIICNNLSRVSICPRGDLCKLAHNNDEVVMHPSVFLTDVCTLWYEERVCTTSSLCTNAHPGTVVHLRTSSCPPAPSSPFAKQFIYLKQHGSLHQNRV